MIAGIWVLLGSMTLVCCFDGVAGLMVCLHETLPILLLQVLLLLVVLLQLLRNCLLWMRQRFLHLMTLIDLPLQILSLDCFVPLQFHVNQTH